MTGALNLKWLRESGIETVIKKEAGRGTLVFGICGGFQMLGNSVSDPYMVESSEFSEIAGMGLLNIDTVFELEKVQKQTKGRFSNVCGILSDLNGKEYEGYEIHMGKSTNNCALEGNKNIYGSYIHGIFDKEEVCDTVLKALCKKKNISFEELNSFENTDYKNKQLDRLADIIRESLDIEQIYRIIERDV